MNSQRLTPNQQAIIDDSFETKLFLEVPAVTGKTTAGVGRLLHLLEASVPAGSILVIVPQRTLASPYYDALRRSTVRAGGQVTILTIPKSAPTTK